MSLQWVTFFICECVRRDDSCWPASWFVLMNQSTTIANWIDVTAIFGASSCHKNDSVRTQHVRDICTLALYCKPFHMYDINILTAFQLEFYRALTIRYSNTNKIKLNKITMNVHSCELCVCACAFAHYAVTATIPHSYFLCIWLFYWEQKKIRSIEFLVGYQWNKRFIKIKWTLNEITQQSVRSKTSQSMGEHLTTLTFALVSFYG